MGCVFCDIVNNPNSDRVISRNNHGIAMRDGFPISEGHTLIIPNRHIMSFFDLEKSEREGLLSLLDSQKIELDQIYNPDGYNIGINDGEAAGQTISHLHIHLIPRYNEPDSDPRGGVRWIIPEKANYWD